MNQKIYTQEQLDIALLKNNTDGVLRQLVEIKSDMKSIRDDLKSNFHWTLGLILSLYAVGGAMIFGVLAKTVWNFLKS